MGICCCSCCCCCCVVVCCCCCCCVVVCCCCCCLLLLVAPCVLLQLLGGLLHLRSGLLQLLSGLHESLPQLAEVALALASKVTGWTAPQKPEIIDVEVLQVMIDIRATPALEGGRDVCVALSVRFKPSLSFLTLPTHPHHSPLRAVSGHLLLLLLLPNLLRIGS